MYLFVSGASSSSGCTGVARWTRAARAWEPAARARSHGPADLQPPSPPSPSPPSSDGRAFTYAFHLSSLVANSTYQHNNPTLAARASPAVLCTTLLCFKYCMVSL